MGGSRSPADKRAGSARRQALKVLKAIDADGAYANLALDQVLERDPAARALGPADRALMTELVYGVTRWRRRLDHTIDAYSTTPSGKLPVFARNALRLGVYQIVYLDKVPDRAAVFESVALAREFGHAGTAALVNAVLRRVARLGPAPLPPEAAEGPADRLAVEFSHPTWLVRRWLDRLGLEETRRLLTVDNEAAPLTLRANRRRVSAAELAVRLEAEGVATSPGRLFPEALICRSELPLRRLASYQAGLFSVQDESAMSAARWVDPQPGWLVVDACAGVGGKSTHLAELMDDTGRVVAVDLFQHKLALLRSAATRLGLGSIETRRLDARELPASDLAGRADAVLVDAPCSGLGVLRRRPDLRWRVGPEDLDQLTELQREILAAAARCVRPGGVLVYATCSIEPAENEAVVGGFLASDHEFVQDKTVLFRPESGGPDGFFTARLLRRGPDLQPSREDDG